MAENESQFWPILYVGSALDRYYQARADVYVSATCFCITRKATAASRYAGPHGGAGGVEARPLVLPPVGGAEGAGLRFGDRFGEYTPDRPGRVKRDLYAGMGVLEYWQYNPTGSYLEPPLLGSAKNRGAIRQRTVQLQPIWPRPSAGYHCSNFPAAYRHMRCAPQFLVLSNPGGCPAFSITVTVSWYPNTGLSEPGHGGSLATRIASLEKPGHLTDNFRHLT